MQVKVCGIRTVEAARACAAARLDFAGLNFVDGRRRAVTPEVAATLVGELAPVTPVGLFQDSPAERVVGVSKQLGLRWVQLHGQESLAYCEGLVNAADVKIIRAVTAEMLQDLAWMRSLAACVDILLVDGPVPGSGCVWRWEALASARRELGDSSPGLLAGRPFWIAGGLNPDNVASAIVTLDPAGVDSATGIEHDGQCSSALIARFCQRARAAETGAVQ